MAKVAFGKFRVMWNAVRCNKDGTEEHYLMRSDRTLLKLDADAAGNSKGWRVERRRILDLTAVRMELMRQNFLVGAGKLAPVQPPVIEVGKEVLSIPTLTDIINAQSSDLDPCNLDTPKLQQKGMAGNDRTSAKPKNPKHRRTR